MSLKKTCLILLVILAAGALLAGCVSQPSPLPIPRVTITSPGNGTTVPAGNVTITIQVQNFTIVDKQGQANVAGEGHVHYYMDVSPLPSTPNQPAIPANADAVWAHVAATSYTFTNVTPGTHTFSVQLANNNHTPVIPLATASVTVTVAPAPETPSITITSPQNGATLPAGNIPVAVSVKNFAIVDKQGQANVPGEGHIHYYLDVSPLPGDPTKPAIPANASAIWAHVAATSYVFTNVSPGMHTISVQLANNDHTPVIPLATDSVMITVTGTIKTPTPTTAPVGGSSGY